MLSLLRWGLGSGNEHLTEKEKILLEEKRNSRALSKMETAHHKRKRSESTQISSTDSLQRPSKRSSQYMSHVEVPMENQFRHDRNATVRVIGNTNVQPSAEPPVRSGTQKGQTVNLTVDAIVNMQISAQVQPTIKHVDMTTVQQRIESEFCLEILLKHRELRLIDQEIAKCQTALEQLRRCSVIPYPALTSRYEDREAVSQGSGIPRQLPVGVAPASQPTPWGVADGPYSRHYARWLLPDPTFDGGVVEETRYVRGSKGLPERQTRGGNSDRFLSSLTSKSRSQRGSASARFQALPAGYPEHKEDKGPMILKRASDGKMVKLVCIRCRRDNFNSAQGFINHCRIAHNLSLPSHEAAAQICGEEIDYNEASAPVPEPTTQQPSSTSLGLVHPLIRSTTVPLLSTPVPRKQQAMVKPPSANAKPVTPMSSSKKPGISKPSQTVQSPFVPSPQTPHLSKLFAKNGRGGDLQTAVSDATIKENLDNIVEDSDSNADSDYEVRNASLKNTSRLPGNSLRGGFATMAPSSSARPVSRKGTDRPGLLVQNAVDALGAHHGPLYDNDHHESTTLTLSETPPHDLSPHTVESNNAPSLVSDDDDDDYASHGSDSSPTSESETEEEGHVNVGFDLMDEDDGTRAGSSMDAELNTSSKAKVHAGGRPVGITRQAAPTMRQTGRGGRKKGGR